ncbi:MAG: condensation domain-containing protein, partial [Psychrosphaera sp.]|nr:condensation domain-containing protein [Psychrosphaera sp.]
KVKPYREYIDWLLKQDNQAAADFWQQQLAAIDNPTPLPQTGSKRVADKEVTGTGTAHLALDEDRTLALKQLARKGKTTLNIVLQAAWAYLLSRYSTESIVVFGTTVAGRPPALVGVEQMIGLFINTIPVCCEIEPQQALYDWIGQLHQSQVTRDEFSYLPLTQIIGQSQLAPGAALFNTLLVVENFPMDKTLGEKADSGGLNLSAIEGFEGTSYALSLLASNGTALAIEFEYDRTYFDGEAITQLMGHLETILNGMGATPDCLVGQLPLLSNVELDYLQHQLNQVDCDFPADIGIHQMFEAQVALAPDNVALVYEQTSLSYAELNRAANQLAHYLRENGVVADTLVGLCLYRSPLMLVALLGVLKAGGAYLPLDPGYPQDRLDHMVKDS